MSHAQTLYMDCLPGGLPTLAVNPISAPRVLICISRLQGMHTGLGIGGLGDDVLATVGEGCL